MEAEVAEVKMPLGSVRRFTATGTSVVFGPEDSYIDNVKVGVRTPIRDMGKGYTVRI